MKVLARPIKEGLDYFPLNVVLNSKFEIIEARFGIKGFAVNSLNYSNIYTEQKAITVNGMKMMLFVFAKTNRRWVQIVCLKY